jgi:hypothetical protein
MLPHKTYEADNFYKQAMQLKARFEVDAPNALFLSQAEQKNLPIDDMPKLLRNGGQTSLFRDQGKGLQAR